MNGAPRSAMRPARRSVEPSVCRRFMIVALLMLAATSAFAGEIHRAASSGDLAAIRALAAADRSVVNARDTGDWTPLHHAAVAGHSQAIRLLVELGADVNARTSGGDTPLQMISNLNDSTSGGFLIDHGATIDAGDNKGLTAMHLAAYSGGTDMLIMLLGRGADITVKSSGGLSVADAARIGKHEELAELLRKYIAEAEVVTVRVDGVAIWYPANSSTSGGFSRIITRYAPGDTAFLALQRLIAPSLAAQDWTKATRTIESYRSLFKGRRSVSQLLEMVNTPARNITVSNLGTRINTAASEYKPVPSADGRWLYFSGLRRADSVGGEDIYASENRGGIWQPAQTLDRTINSSTHESVNSISTDGNRLFFFGNYEASLGSGDIFHADRTASGWSALQHLPAPINSSNFETDALMTSDGRAILFVSDRPGGIGPYRGKDSAGIHSTWGNLDIYVCIKSDTGWSVPINLGSKINTRFAERTPFLHADGRTLYFSSEGHYGMGDLDLFRSVRLREDSWTEWSEPVNLGKEINTIFDDMGYKITTAGDVAYFSASSRSDGLGETDIYSVLLPPEARPDAVASISGRVTDDNGQPIAVTIKWQDLATGQVLGELTSNPQDGSYFIVLPLGRNYGYFAEKEGHYPASKNIDLKGRTTAQSLTENITLVSIDDMTDREAIVRLNNLFFEHDRFDLKPESYPELARLAAILKGTPGVKVEIMGHTDDQGADAYNMTLSNKRAQAVLEYLVTLGCARAALTARGYGESKPTVANDSEENRALNRRVEARFVR